MMKLPIETKNEMFGLYLYPEANIFRERQQDIMWFAQDIKVEKDVQDYRVNMTEDELDLVKFTLQLFVEIEQSVGDIWDKIANWFPHSEIEGCASQIASMEKSVHAFFYQKMSDELLVDPKETYDIQQTVYQFKSKLDYIKTLIEHADGNKLLTLAAVSMIEQVMLFSNFAMLKSFQANGNNLIPNTISGVDYVINDEVLHGEFSSYLFTTYLKEAGANINVEQLKEDIYKLAGHIIAHEEAVIDLLFTTDDKSINGINSIQLKTFVKSRMNYVLQSLGYTPIYDESNNLIAKWFYKNANSIKMHDFFVKGTNSYKRTWSENSFSRLRLNND